MADIQKVIKKPTETETKTKPIIDFALYPVEAFKKIKDPVKWQQDLRAQWQYIIEKL